MTGGAFGKRPQCDLRTYASFLEPTPSASSCLLLDLKLSVSCEISLENERGIFTLNVVQVGLGMFELNTQEKFSADP